MKLKQIPCDMILMIAKDILTGLPVLLVILSCSPGCSSYSRLSRLKLMPIPDIYDGAATPVYPDNAPYEGVLYVTDREPSDANHVESFYRNARGSLLRTGLGEVIVSNNETRPDQIVLKVASVQEYGVLSKALPYDFLTSAEDLEGVPTADDSFISLINGKLSCSEQKDIFLFIHGYKSVFEYPLLVSAELWHFLGYDGVFIAYAWPSTPKRLAYFKDIETAQLSGHNLRLLLTFLSQHTDAEQIHIIGYSAGTRVVMTALHQLALIHQDKPKEFFQEDLRIGQVALVGSDYDSQKFAAAIADGVLQIPHALTIYMSANDDALGLSRFLFRENRLGQFTKDAGNVPSKVQDFFTQNQILSFVNVTDAEKSNSGNGHAYFRKSPWASSDLLMSLKHDLGPDERGLVQSEGEIHWNFPPDYMEKLRSAVERATEEKAPRPSD